jgi:hypothetical protein
MTKKEKKMRFTIADREEWSLKRQIKRYEKNRVMENITWALDGVYMPTTFFILSTWPQSFKIASKLWDVFGLSSTRLCNREKKNFKKKIELLAVTATSSSGVFNGQNFKGQNLSKITEIIPAITYTII